MIRITTLVENSQGEHLSLVTEHGISFLIEMDAVSLLFDTGQSDAYITNAALLQRDLNKVKHIILSHGHYDHSGGFPYFIEQVSSDVDLWISKDFFRPKYGYNGKAYEYLGNRFSQQYLHQNGITTHRVDADVTEVVSDVFIVTNFQKHFPSETINPRFRVEVDDAMEIDDFRDEVMVVVQSPKGLIALVGCSHPGIMNMLQTVQQHFKQPLYAVLGGTHLVEADASRMKESVQYFADAKVKRIGVSHCTGQAGMTELSQFSDAYYHNRTGSSLII